MTMVPLNIAQALPPVLISFLATTLLAFVVGLELHSYRRAANEPLAFGTTRTLTLIATLGFIFYHLGGWQPYMAGLLVIGAWLGLFYWHRLAEDKEHVLSLLVAHPAFSDGERAWTNGDLAEWAEVLQSKGILRHGAKTKLKVGVSKVAGQASDHWTFAADSSTVKCWSVMLFSSSAVDPDPGTSDPRLLATRMGSV